MKNTNQQEIVIATYKKGESQAVKARAGSGKTSTLVAALQAAPPSTLSVAFNKATALELEAKMPSHVVSKTMNSLGHSAWLRHTGKQVKLDTKKLFTLFNTYPHVKQLKEDVLDIVKMVRLAKASGVTSGFNLPPPNKEDWLAIAEAHDIIEPEGLLPHAEWLLFENCKQSFAGVIDFDDQIYMSVMYKAIFTKYASVAVDEAQDLSPLQHIMIERSLRPDGQLTIVGDPAQAIYGFRGASTSSFQDFVTKFNLKVNPLTASFRCPKAVVREAQKYVPDIEAASSREGKVTVISGPINPKAGVTVLCRTNAPLIRLAFESIRKHIPPNYLGRDFMSGLKALHKKYPTVAALNKWADGEAAKAKSDAAVKRLEDRMQSMLVLHETGDVDKALEKLLSTPKESALTLSTIHKAKGKEWSSVVYFDYYNEWLGAQEDNIKYVGCTRSMDELFLHKK
jgi:superfamily I DNA/RNA helicase